MRTSFSSFITFVSSSIWLDSCFVLTPKRKGLLFAEVGQRWLLALSSPLTNIDCCFPSAGTVFLGNILRESIPESGSYPGFGQSLFVGSGSLVTKPHSQRSPRPPASARPNCPVGIRHQASALTSTSVRKDRESEVTWSLVCMVLSSTKP